VLSQENGFSSGTPCNLFEDTPEELNKLDADTFGYDSDSDLDNDEPEIEDLLPPASRETCVSENQKSYTLFKRLLLFISRSEGPPTETDNERSGPKGPVSGRAFAINGTAYKTCVA